MKVACNITEIVNQGLCTSCGTCVNICPSSAIKMVETTGGLLFARICIEKCKHCGLCAKVCPGDHLNPDILKNVIDPFKGKVLSAYYGKAADPEFHKKGQSGGIASALLNYLLDAGTIEKALVTQIPPEGTLRPVCKLINNKYGILQSQGSQYCPVAVNSFISKRKDFNLANTAIIGLPCHFHGLKNMLDGSNLPAPLLIGLICDRIMSFRAIDYLTERSGLPKQNILNFRYRDKSLGGWPGNTNIKSKDGQTLQLRSKHRMWCKDYFTPSRCYLCFDKMNIFSDIALGDAWGVKEDKSGYSVVLARTERGRAIIDQASTDGAIEIEPINPEAIFAGQKIETKRRDWSAFTVVWQQSGKKIPDFGIDPRWHADISNVSRGTYKKKLANAAKLVETRSGEKLVKDVQKKYFLKRFKAKIKALFKG